MGLLGSLRSSAAAGCACILLSACAGAGQYAIPVRSNGTMLALKQPRVSKETLAVRINVPAAAAASKGVTIAYSGPSKAQQTLNVTATGPGCKKSAGSLVCTSALELDSGTYLVSVGAYNDAPVKGRIPSGAKLLASAEGASLLVQAKPGNTFGVVLGGVPKSLILGALPSATAGSALQKKAFAVNAKDASANLIVGSYEKPVALTDIDASGATAVFTAGGDHPKPDMLLSSSDSASMSYTGLAISRAVIRASAAGATTASANFTPLLHAIGPATLAGYVYLNPFGTVSPVTFTASEIGWTNAPFNRTFATQLTAGCDNIATVTPSQGTTFTATLVSSPSAGDCSFVLSDGAGQQLHIPIGYAQFSFTGEAQPFPVPASVNQLTIAIAGAQGGTSSYGGTGGEGGSVTATIPVASFETLNINVGGAGSVGGNAGYNGGGASSGASGTSGGDASDVREGGGTYASRVLVAGGGAGSTTGNGGAGGYPNGGVGCTVGYTAAGGGTQSSGGAGGPGKNNANGGDGQLGAGGIAGVGIDGPNGGGGGGGYYGGGGGGGGGFDTPGGCGAGGSSYAEPSAKNVTYGSGTQTGNGLVTITY